jgi:3',5'-nucleoside bisphosphate phosphatase
VIDLHAHTTASDGWLEPHDLVARALDAGVRTLGVTDHDTMAGVAAAREAGVSIGVGIVPGIEITAIEGDDDVHVLGYFLDEVNPRLGAFLDRQREDRIRRVREMASRLASLGCAIDVDPLLRRATAAAGRAIGRPLLARALVERGHAIDARDAFDRLLGRGCPAFVPRSGAHPTAVVAIIHDAGGLASLAHPGTTDRDDLLPALGEAGLDAIEVHHPDHAPEDVERYAAVARRMDLLVTGGSDFHGNPDHGAVTLGAATITPHDFERLLERRRIRCQAP